MQLQLPTHVNNVESSSYSTDDRRPLLSLVHIHVPDKIPGKSCHPARSCPTIEAEKTNRTITVLSQNSSVN